MMFSEKLGNCQVCESEPAKYTCPRCELRTCSLACVNNHKADMKCSGLRDKTAYKTIAEFTNLDFLSDYRLLEDISQSVDTFARDQNKRYTRSKGDLPKHLFLLREAAHMRDMRLWFLPHNFSRHKENTTYLDWKTRVVSWRVQWIFADALHKNTQMVDTRVCEALLLRDCLQAKLTENSSVLNYQEAGIDNICLLLRAENRKNASTSFFLLDMNSSLKDNLRGHTLVEFPVIRVVFTHNLSTYTLITLDDKREETCVGSAPQDDKTIQASTSSKISFLPITENTELQIKEASPEAASSRSKITTISESTLSQRGVTNSKISFLPITENTELQIKETSPEAASSRSKITTISESTLSQRGVTNSKISFLPITENTELQIKEASPEAASSRSKITTISESTLSQRGVTNSKISFLPITENTELQIKEASPEAASSRSKITTISESTLSQRGVTNSKISFLPITENTELQIKEASPEAASSRSKITTISESTLSQREVTNSKISFLPITENTELQIKEASPEAASSRSKITTISESTLSQRGVTDSKISFLPITENTELQIKEASPEAASSRSKITTISESTLSQRGVTDSKISVLESNCDDTNRIKISTSQCEVISSECVVTSPGVKDQEKIQEALDVRVKRARFEATVV